MASWLCIIQYSRLSSFLPPVEAHLSGEPVADGHLYACLGPVILNFNRKISLFVMREIMFSFLEKHLLADQCLISVCSGQQEEDLLKLDLE